MTAQIIIVIVGLIVMAVVGYFIGRRNKLDGNERILQQNSERIAELQNDLDAKGTVISNQIEEIRKLTSERVTGVMIGRAKECKWNGARVPYGWAWDEASEKPIHAKPSKSGRTYTLRHRPQ